MGPLIKVARLEAKLTQDELAERIGVTPRYIMAIENEGKCPALDVWFKLIRTLHISADTIVYPENSVTKDDDEQLILMIRMVDSRNKQITIAEKVSQILDLDYCAIDFFDTVDKRPLVCEVNANPGGIEDYEKITGVNQAEKLVEFIVKKLYGNL